MARYITPAVTPLLPDGRIDEASCRRLYDHLIEGGVDGILILGSIGEFFAFPMEERRKLIRIAVEAVAGRVELIVGTTSMVFREIVDLSNEAYEIGADSVMVIPPYYFHFNDAEVEAYYDALAQELKGKFYLYNFPDRMGYGIAPEVVCRLAKKHSHLIGIKDTIAGVDHTREIIKLVKPVCIRSYFFKKLFGKKTVFLRPVIKSFVLCFKTRYNFIGDFKLVSCKLQRLFGIKNILSYLLCIKEPEGNVCAFLFFIDRKTFSSAFGFFFKGAYSLFKNKENVL